MLSMKKLILLAAALIFTQQTLEAFSIQQAINYAYVYSAENPDLHMPRSEFYNISDNTKHDPNTWYDYEKGSNGSGDDCANFVSQCLITGGLDSLMNYSGVVHPDGDNQYNSNIIGTVTTKSNATIIGVTDNALQDYLTNYYHAGYIYALADPSIVGGDVFVIPQGKGETRHAMFIVDVNGTALSCDAHTTDRQNYVMHSDLSAYSYSPCLYSFFHIYPTVKMWISGYMTLQVLWFGKKW
jgi:hypothetical protein